MAALRWSGVWPAVLMALVPVLADTGGASRADATPSPSPEVSLAVAGPPFDTTEAGVPVSLELRLDRRPREDVTFQVRSTNELEATVEPRTVTVAAGGDDPPAPVRLTVTGVQDDVDDDEAPFAVEVEAVAGDPAFLALGVRRIELFNLDDDVAGVRVSPGVLLVRPGGPPASFTAVLTSRPQGGGVEAAVTSNRPDAGKVSLEGLQLPGGSAWQEPVSAHVTPAAQAPAELRSWQVSLAPVWSGDPLFSWTAPDPVTVVLIGSGAGFTVAPTHGLATTEDGGAATFSVALNTRPAAPVTLALASSDPQEATVFPAALVFTPVDWDAVRTVTVTGRDDGRDDGPARYRVTVSPAAGASAAGASAAVELVSLPAAASAKSPEGEVVLLAPAEGLTVRAGEAARFALVLSRPPGAEVWVHLRSDPPEAGTVEPPSLCFSPRDWSTPRPVLVRAGAPGSFRAVTDLTWSRDSGFRGLDPGDLPITVLGEDPAGSYFTIPPCRLYNSRQVPPGGDPLRAGRERLITVHGRCGVPAGARAVAANLTVVSPTGAGSLVVHPAGQSPPVASALSYAAGAIRSDAGVFPLSADGRLAVRPSVAGNGTLHLTVDVVGYFE